MRDQMAKKNEMQYRLGFGIFLIILICGVPTAGAQTGEINPTMNSGEKNITIDIFSPEEGDIIFYDVVPAYLTVQGIVDAPQGIRNITILNYRNTSNDGEVLCGNNVGTHYNFSCSILISNQITVVVTDNTGNRATATRNITRKMRPPGPGDIWVKGWITDPKGNPISDAIIIFERIGDNKILNVTTKSKTDGSYSMKKASGSTQKITIFKEGYQTIIQESTFRNYNNRLNFTLVPVSSSVPGFHVPVSLSAILICIIFMRIGKRE